MSMYGVTSSEFLSVYTISMNWVCRINEVRTNTLTDNEYIFSIVLLIVVGLGWLSNFVFAGFFVPATRMLATF